MSRLYRQARVDGQLLTAAWLAFLLFSAALLAGCDHAPPHLTPQATTAWYATRVVKGLDVLRDTAIDANAVVPPLLSEATTRKIVNFHQSSLRSIQATPSGWQTGVLAALDEVMQGVSPRERDLLAPYVTIVRVLIEAVK